MMPTSSHTHSRFEHVQNPDEVQQLIESTDANAPDNNTVDAIATSSTHSLSKLPHNHNVTHSIDSSKLGADTFAGLAMIIIGTIMYGVEFIISRLSMLGNKSTPYQSAAAMVVAESGKFIISVTLLLQSEGIKKSIFTLKSVSLYELFLFAIPAASYSITNNLDFYILQYMDPGSMQVLVQTKIITTALLWWYWFKQRIHRQQWVALLLLCIGSMLVALPEDEHNTNDDDDDNRMHSVYVEWPLGPLLIAIQICVSALAGVYTEWIYNKYGRNRSIHIDNLSMYFWGTLSNGLQFFYMNRDKDSETYYLLYGFNYWTWLLISVYIIKGSILVQIIKYFSNIVKLFTNGASILITGCLTLAIFGLKWTVPYVSGLFLAIIAVLMYKAPAKCIK